MRILIAEDEVEIAELLSLYLESEGFETVIFHNGKEALESLKKDDYEVLLADIMMPEIDGIEACRRITATEEYKDIPVIFVTALGDTHKLAEALDAGGSLRGWSRACGGSSDVCPYLEPLPV